MSLDEPIKEVTLRLKKETTARETKLKRFVEKNPETGFIEAKYPIEIDMESITYELDANDNKVDIYEIQLHGNISLEPAEIMSLWTEPIILSNGTTAMLGNVIADKIDAIIANRLNPPTP